MPVAGMLKVFGYNPTSKLYSVRKFDEESHRWKAFKNMTYKEIYKEINKQFVKLTKQGYINKYGNLKGVQTIKNIAQTIAVQRSHNKAQTIKTNMKTVLDAKIDDSRYPELGEAIIDKINAMSDEEITLFAEKYEGVINIYFMYDDDDTVDEIDARFVLMAKALGIDVKKYDVFVEKDKKLMKQVKLDESYIDFRFYGKQVREGIE